MFLDETTDTKTELSFKTKIQIKVNNFIAKIKKYFKKFIYTDFRLKIFPYMVFYKT